MALPVSGYADVWHKSCADPGINLAALNESSEFSYQSSHLSGWLPNPSSTAGKNGSIILIHGLNNLPFILDELGGYMQTLGYDVFRLALTGHRGDSDEIRGVKMADWLADAYTAYCLVKQRDPIGKVAFVGTSLGALVGLSVQTLPAASQPMFDWQILLTPAIEPKYLWLAPAVHSLWVFNRALMPYSGIPDGYRCNQSASVNAFYALYQLVDRYRGLDSAQIPQVPTLMLLDPKDELIDETRTREFIEQRHLESFEVSNFIHRPEPLYYHLAVDSKSLGPDNWQMVKDLLRRYAMVGKH